jgi:hypothetical protein
VSGLANEEPLKLGEKKKIEGEEDGRGEEGI